MLIKNLSKGKLMNSKLNLNSFQVSFCKTTKKSYRFTWILLVLTILPIALIAQNLVTKDIKIGNGKEALKGSQVTVHYVGKLDNGTKFDSSRDRGTPFTFTLGEGQVIQGWDKGVFKMKEGGIRKLTIPPSLGYGSRAVGPIPPNSTLHFEVELIKVQ
jgi:FKBP-type peptidyl-prolyl cis-trans isomerase